MGETMAEAPRDQIEIQKSTASEAIFKNSVSFGKFDEDLLQWERWSSFSQNKYLEEVGKCSTPGSVAEKKAYFEAHYKKIASRKAEMMDQGQEQETEDELFRSDTQSNGNLISNGCGTRLEYDTIGVDGVTSSTEPSHDSIDVDYINQTEEPNQDGVGVNCQDSYVESVREEVVDLPDSPKSNEFEGAFFVKDDTQYIEIQGQPEELFELVIEHNNLMDLPAHSEQVDGLVQEENVLIGSQDPLEQSPKLDIESETSHIQKNKMEDAQPKLQKEPQKRTPVSKDKISAKTKKKAVAPTAKTTHTPLPRASKLAPASPAPRISTGRESSPSLLNKSSPSSVKKKISTPNALHMSLTLEPAKSDMATGTTTRKYLIMEKMGDKDIVKRAFRAFQNNFSLSKPSTEEKPSNPPQQVSTRGTARVTSTSMTPQKERLKKPVESTSSQRKQVGARASSVPSRPVRVVGQYQTSSKASPSSVGLKSDERAVKRVELSKKAEVKTNAKEPERPRLLSQSKVKREAEMKRLSQSLTSKTTLMPEQRAFRKRENKVGASDETDHKPDSGR